MVIPVASREPEAPSIRFSIRYVPFGIRLREKSKGQQCFDLLLEPCLPMDMIPPGHIEIRGAVVIIDCFKYAKLVAVGSEGTIGNAILF